MSELIIALVDTPSVFVIGMPHLTAVPATTLGTLNFGRKYRHTLYLELPLPLRYISDCTKSKSSGSMIAGWLFST